MKSTLRRLKLEDLLSKVEQIDEQAALTLSEYPTGHTIERQRLIIAIARQIRSHLEDQLRLGSREKRVAVIPGDLAFSRNGEQHGARDNAEACS